MRILVLEHERDAPAGLLSDWIAARGHELALARVRRLRRWPDVRHYGAVVSLGSEASVYASRHAWIERELEFLADAHAAEIPVLGICFGGQALARALGGEVGPAARTIVGWQQSDSAAPDLIPGGPWFHWHSDRFVPPPEARLLASAGGEADAFAVGRSIGVQFHPEASGTIIEGWIAGEEARPTRRAIDTASVRVGLRHHALAARARSHDLFDRIAGWWAQR